MHETFKQTVGLDPDTRIIEEIKGEQQDRMHREWMHKTIAELQDEIHEAGEN